MAIQILGVAFAGVLVSDCLAIYDDINPLQQKCYSHHLKAIKQARAAHPQQGVGYLAGVKAMLQGAMALKKAQPDMAQEDFALRRQGLEMAAATLLARPRAQPAEERVRNRLCKQSDHLFTFLDYPEVDATNNRAERQLRRPSSPGKYPAATRPWPERKPGRS